MADTPLEIPQAMRDAVEQNLKQAQAAYEQLMDFVTKAMGAWTSAMPASPMATGLKDVQERVAAMAKQNAGSVFAFAGKISNAQTLQDVLMLQTQFAQDQMQAYARQTQELQKLIGEALQNLQHG
jgi:hypothetical protein